MTDELVRERHGSVLVARLNRPEVANALDLELLTALGAMVIEVETDPEVRAVVLTGTGERTFCAGLDLRSGLDVDDPTVDAETRAAFTRLLEGDVSFPLVGAANGSAVAGGLELLLACDVVVAAAGARFGLPEVARGLFPGGSGTTIGQRVGIAVGLEMTLTGEPISAERAYEVGLVNAVVPAGDVLATARSMADRIAANAPLGVAACRELVRLAVTDPDRAIARRDHWREVVFRSADAREGAAAFVEKRPPVWKGR
jgi:enoyl-CoA hydratase/carnithine racemase